MVVRATSTSPATWSPRHALAGGELLRDVAVFDVYRDEQALGAGRRSLALRLTFQADDRTLTDDEVLPLRNAVVADARGTVRRGAAGLSHRAARGRVGGGRR